MDASPREAARRAVLTDADATITELVDTIRGQIPAYDTLSEAQLGEVTAIARWATSRLLDLWVTDSELTDADLNRFRGIGAARALDGRPLPGVLRAYRIAGRALVDVVVRAGGERLTVTDVMALASLRMTSIDGLSEALFEGHTSAADRLAEDRGRAVADLLDDLVMGRQVTLTALTDRSRRLGLAIPDRPTLLVVRDLDPSAVEDALGRAIGPQEDRGGPVSDDILRTVRAGLQVMVATRSTAAAVVAAVTESGGRGCVMHSERVTDLARAFRLAELCLERAPEHAFAQRPVLDEGDAQVLALLAGSQAGDPSALRRCVLGEVADPSNAHVLEGLDAFLAHGSATAAAEALGLHAQTMRYRLGRLQALTGRDPRHSWDRLVLQASRVAVLDELPGRSGT